MLKEIEMLRYYESVELPKFKASLDRLLNKKFYDLILSSHSVRKEELPQFVEKAITEGNAVLIEKGYNGYIVIVWKD